MSIVFDHLPADVTEALDLQAACAHRSVEEVALEALRRGLANAQAFDEAATWVEAPSFDAALHVFAEMEGE